MTLHPLIKKFLPVALGLALAGVFMFTQETVNTSQAAIGPQLQAKINQCGTGTNAEACLTNLVRDPLCLSTSPLEDCLDAIDKAKDFLVTSKANLEAAKPKDSGNQWCGFSLNPFTWVTCAIVMTSYVVNLIIGGLFVTLGAWLAQNALNLSAHVMELPIIETGFTVSLALANLGFVLGIIIIAIATILRIENYGMKQLLWKLVVMAVVVNFSMAIAGMIVNSSNAVANYFMDRASPTVGLPLPGQWDKGNTFKFVEAITTGFGPQIAYRAPFIENNSVADVSSWSGLTGLVVAVASFIFTAIFLTLIAVCFMAIAILFLMRFTFIAFLLILMPLAWLSWVFPLMKSNWDKWWSNFLKWVFFAPLCIFFLYLAVLSTQQDTSKKFLENYGQSQNTAAVKTDAVNALSRLTNANTGLLNAIAQMFVLLGLAFGGLFMANSLSITGAATAMGAVKAGGKAAGGWARKRVGGGMARFATQIPAATPPPPGGGLRGGIARLQHTISTSAPVSGVRNVVQKVTTSNIAVQQGITQSMQEYGSKTDPQMIRDTKTKRQEAWNKAKEAKAIPDEIVKLEAKAVEAEKNAHDVKKIVDLIGAGKTAEADKIVNANDALFQMKKSGKSWEKAVEEFEGVAVDAIEDAKSEARKISDIAQQGKVMEMIERGKVGTTKKAIEDESVATFKKANELAKKNPSLVSMVTSAVEKAVTGHGKVSDHSKHEIAEALGIQMAHGDDHGGGDHGGGHGGDHGGGAHGAGGGGNDAHATPAH